MKFKPSREFNKKLKSRFLAAFDAHYPVVMNRPSEFILAAKALAGVLALAAIVLGGASVYADTKNVSADNPLYPLKRFGESVQLALATPEEKPQLEAALATRRADEITDLEDRHPTSTLLPKLASDFGNAVSSSIDNEEQEEKKNPQQANLKEVCNTLQRFLGATSSIINNEFSNNSGTVRRFEKHCGQHGGGASKNNGGNGGENSGGGHRRGSRGDGGDNSDGNDGNANATTTTDTNTNATTSVSSTTFSIQHSINGGDEGGGSEGGRGHGENGGDN